VVLPRQEGLLSAVADLARLGASEPLEDALREIDRLARELSESRDPGARAGLAELGRACDVLAGSLGAEQQRVIRDIVDLQGQIQLRRRYAGAPAEAPAFERRG
jgi:hypothetical protein